MPQLFGYFSFALKANSRVYLSLLLYFHILQQGKQKGAKNKINLRRSPFYLQDGDIIGVKVINLKPPPLIFY